jgi:hypothetical protein
VNIPIPEPLEKALELADKLGVLEEVAELVQAAVAGDGAKAKLAAETAAIKAAARAPYLAQGG